MHEFIQGGELKVQAKRLLGYRMPLILVIIVNIVLIARIPMPPSRQAQAQGPASDLLARVDAQLEAPSTPSGEPSLVNEHQLATHEPPQLSSAVEPHIQLPSGAGLAFSTSLPETPSNGAQQDDTEQSGWALQPDYVPPLNFAADDVVATDTDTLAATPANLPTIPLTAWQHGAQQLVARWKQSAQSILSPVEREISQTPTAPAIEPTLGVERADLPTTDLTMEPEGTRHQHGRAERITAPVLDETCFAVRNPRGNMETIRFLVNRRLCELQPGEAHQFPPSDEWLIQFHPGGDFEDVERIVTQGIYQFVVTQQGWDLVPIASDMR